MTYTKLIRAAQSAKKNSISPYSKFRVGAAIMTRSGKIYSGCNIENSSFSLTICAERTAIFKALSEGRRGFKAIAIVSDVKTFVPPCGACRQVLLELAGDIDIVMVDGSGKVEINKASHLLPSPFIGNILTK